MYSLVVLTVASACCMPIAAPPLPASPMVAKADALLPEMTRGTITGLDADRKFFTVHTGASDVDVTWNDQTMFMYEGKRYKWDEIVKENATVIVTHQRGVASKVEAVKKS